MARYMRLLYFQPAKEKVVEEENPLWRGLEGGVKEVVKEGEVKEREATKEGDEPNNNFTG